jgi:hypothetical protein
MHSIKNSHVFVYQKKRYENIYKQINLVDVKGKKRELKRAGNSGHTTSSFPGTKPAIPIDVGSSRRIKMEEMRDGAVRVSGTERIRVTNSGSGNNTVEDSGTSHGNWWVSNGPARPHCLSIYLASLDALSSLYLINTWDFEERLMYAQE